MKNALAVILSLSFLAWAILLCEARPMNSVNIASTSAFAPAPNSSAGVIVHQKLKVSYMHLARDGSFEAVTSNGRKYGVYTTKKDDISGGSPIMTHEEGHSPGVGH
ncbi:hypothetical protein SUGI_0699410 [Cryptomeria japonica]|nr:hypothetical protein SUGI_0699410 [Cryptomeria japonica]